MAVSHSHGNQTRAARPSRGCRPREQRTWPSCAILSATHIFARNARCVVTLFITEAAVAKPRCQGAAAGVALECCVFAECGLPSWTDSFGLECMHEAFAEVRGFFCVQQGPSAQKSFLRAELAGYTRFFLFHRIGKRQIRGGSFRASSSVGARISTKGLALTQED